MVQFKSSAIHPLVLKMNLFLIDLFSLQSEPAVVKPNEAEERLDDLIKSLQKVSSATPTTLTSGSSSSSTSAAVSSISSFKPSSSSQQILAGNSNNPSSAETMIPNNQSGLASTSLAKPLPLDNYKNNILKAKSQDENKKVGGNAMLSFPTTSSSNSTTTSIDDKSR